MKSISRFLVIALVVGLAISAFAAGVKNVDLRSDATLNGAKLAKGMYKVVIDGSGPEVKVNFMQNDKVVVSAPGKLVDAGSAPQFSAVVVDKNTNIQELRIEGQKSKVVFNE